jgi:HTH-type transcriptional regulator/antitoxin HipB
MRPGTAPSADDRSVTAFDLPGALRRVRRMADLSQRDLAAAAGVSPSAIGQAESGSRDMPVRLVATIAALAGLRLALVDDGGTEVTPMTDEAVRDMGGRRFPAHLDTRYSDEGWWHDAHRYSRHRPWYTFDRDRERRDAHRDRAGTPEDHLLARPGDSPAARAEARRREYRRQKAEERERRFLAGEFAHLPDAFICSCPQECDELDDRSGKPVHVEGCPCGCDVA